MQVLKQLLLIMYLHEYFQPQIFREIRQSLKPFRLQTGCYVTANSVLEDDVFLGPGVFTYNDNTMARHAPDHPIVGPTIRRAARIGGGARILPGIEIGEEAFVATGAVVTRDVPARALVMGVPARKVGEVGDEELIERWS